MNHPYKGIWPAIHESVFIAEGVHIIGDVHIDEQATIWYNTVLRGDLAPIRIGKRTNVQDGSIGHVNTDQPLILEDDVSVGHGVHIHGCTVRKGSLIGMGAILLNGAEIGEFSLIAAGSLVPENKRIPPYTLAMGSPAKIVRELTEQDLERMVRTKENYVIKGREYLEQERGSKS